MTLWFILAKNQQSVQVVSHLDETIPLADLEVKPEVLILSEEQKF